MRTDTTIHPIKEQRYNPVTGRVELMDTGMVAEFSMGKQISSPFKMPTPPSAEAVQALRSQGNLHGDNGYAKATIYTPDNRSLAAHHARPGETAGQAADRLADAASRFEVKNGRAASGMSANGVPYLSGNG